MKPTAPLLALFSLVLPVLAANEIGFVEDFSLADDRASALKQLIPGTEHYYFYHCLHYQHTGDTANYDKMLKAWIKRRKYTTGVKELINRQALIDYEKNPDACLRHIIDELDLHFNHARVIADQKPNYPTRLDPNRISIPALLKRAFQQHSNLEGVEPAGLDILPHAELDPARRRDLLSRLTRPDIPGLADLVVADLKYKHSGGFGSHPIHDLLTRAQLDACVAAMPRLQENARFVHATIAKLAASDDVDLRFDRAEESAYVDRLLAYTRKLAPAFMSLKAHALYNRLRLDRDAGRYDHELFIEYISVPRPVHYMNPEYLRTASSRNVPQANLNEPFQGVTLFPRIQNDEPLVRDCLAHFFIEGDSYEPYERFILDSYLKKILAETKIVNGIGDPEQWTSLLTPAEYQALKDRIDLAFSPTNPAFFDVDDPVSLDLFVKNVETLIVKVFRINAFNYYRLSGSEITTAIDLDGLVAEDEQVLTYDDAPVRRVRRSFDFPQCSEPGVYVIEWIGNGVSSRAVVRKGQLHVNEGVGPAGHEFTVYDENNQPRPGATLWLSGKEYTPGEDGIIFVPFSTAPGSKPVILTDGERCSLAHFDHQGEAYELNAGFFVDRESLLRRGEAQVLVRPRLLLNGRPASLTLLEDVRLGIGSSDHDGVSTSTEIPDVELAENGEFVHTFNVPDKLATLSFSLAAEVEDAIRGEKTPLAALRTFAVNTVDKGLLVEDLLLGRDDGAYQVHVLGKNGEPKADRPVQITLKHRYFTREIHETLQTDAEGIVHLGELPGIAQITAAGPEQTSRSWETSRDRYSYPVLHGTAGEPLRVPYVGSLEGEPRLHYTLLERRGSTYLADHTAALQRENGFLVAPGNLPAGDYELFLKSANLPLPVRLTGGPTRDNHVFSKNRVLQKPALAPLQIASVEPAGKNLTITLANTSPFTRVHVVATRFQPRFHPFQQLYAVGPALRARPLGRAETLYVAGRNIGDEYRYILERRHADIFPGNLLNRPGLLLNPWSVRKTQTETAEAAAGEDFDAVLGDVAHEGVLSENAVFYSQGGSFTDPSNLDFLASPSVVLANLKPDKQGIVTVDRDDLGAHAHVCIVAIDPLSTVCREVSLPDTPEAPRDLRLIGGLDPNVPASEQKTVSAHGAGDAFHIDDITTSKMEVFDSLGSVFSLFETLSSDPTLDEFRFVLRWPSMDETEKRDLYAKYACHELSFFLYHKDRPFFDTVIQPYLANKKDKTFLDRWLLEDDLAAYLDAWAFGQLNTLERILLFRRSLPGGEGIPRDIQDRTDLIPPNPDVYNHLFDTALKGSALDKTDRFGLADLKQVAEMKKESHALRRMAKRGRQAGQDVSTLGLPVDSPMPASAPAPMVTGDMIALGREAQEMAGAKLMVAEAEMEEAMASFEDKEMPAGAGTVTFRGARVEARRQARRLFRQLDKTEEWAENNYYKLPIGRQNADLVTVNGYWNDYAAHPAGTPFLSTNFMYATRNFAEMMLALAVLDLPFEAPEHESEGEEGRFTLTPADGLLVAFKSIRESKPLEEKLPILVSQNFFRADDRYRHEGNERFDKFVTEEFLNRIAYGCQVVLTNPTSSRQKLTILLQIPEGALPLQTAFYTRSTPLTLEPYSTQTFDYYFYFPETGAYRHFPVHVARNERHAGAGEPFLFNVVESLSKIDTASWDYISQNGSEKDVLGFLDNHNLHRHDLEKTAWRMKDKKFYRAAMQLLDARRIYHHVLSSYSLFHNDTVRAREYLRHSPYAARCGAWIDTPLLTIDPVERKTYEHLEYKPLVNARAHVLGKRRRILNNRFREQYHAFLNVLRYRPALTDADRLGVSYYMFLQDRVAEGLEFFSSVPPDGIHEKLQYDYVKIYADFYTGDLEAARAAIGRYDDHPVPRWQRLFADAGAQLAELAGEAVAVTDEKDREQIQDQLAATEPSLEFTVEDRRVRLAFQKLEQCVVNYYPMDIELLFSRNPFVQEETGHFAYITPRASDTLALAAEGGVHEFDLPEAFRAGNVMIEIVAGGLRRSQAYYANALSLQVVETYGRLQVLHEESREPLPETYVKVYARRSDGSVKFYKDGYTDRRGKFDYVSLSTSDLADVDRFALLILHPDHGATIKEAPPPQR